MCVECGNIFSKKAIEYRRFENLAEEEKQAGIQGQWQLESPAKEYLEQVKSRDNTYCTEKS